MRPTWARRPATRVRLNKNRRRRFGLYTLGQLFEQSITELEILEAEADGRPSINKLSKRKRDGVYYTPEWVVERIVAETLGPRLAQIKLECGWKIKDDQSLEALDAYAARLKAFTVVDPACGSGAFLIAVLRYLLGESREIQGLRRLLTGGLANRDEDTALIAGSCETTFMASISTQPRSRSRSLRYGCTRPVATNHCPRLTKTSVRATR